MYREKDLMWWKQYETLDFKGGTPTYICEDDQDMIEIRYSDGMMIDVGYLENLVSEGRTPYYQIIVVEKDDAEGWKEPLYDISVYEKSRLYNSIQEVINKFRRNV